MGTDHLGRRQLLTAAGAGLLATTALGGTAAAAPSHSNEECEVTGGWLITRRDKGTPGPIRSVLTFADGGAFVGLDLKPTAPPYLGTWQADSEQAFTAVFWTPITDNSGASIGTGRIRATGAVDGNKISGTYTAVVFLANGRQHGSGTFHGTRIEAD